MKHVKVTTEVLSTRFNAFAVLIDLVQCTNPDNYCTVSGIPVLGTVHKPCIIRWVRCPRPYKRCAQKEEANGNILSSVNYS